MSLWKRRIRSLVLAGLCSGTFLSGAAAQSVCQEILSEGTLRRISSNERYYSSLAYAARLERMNYDEARRTLSQSGSFSIPGVGSLTASSSESDFRRTMNLLRQSVDLSAVRENEAQLAVADGDPEIVRAWENCIGRLAGVVTRLRPLDDTTIQLIVVYRPYPGREGSPTIEPGTHVTGATIQAGGEYLVLGSTALTVANPRVITLRRQSPDVAVNATVNTNFGSASTYLPPHPIARSPDPEQRVAPCIAPTSPSGGTVHLFDFNDDGCPDIASMIDRQRDSVIEVNFGHRSGQQPLSQMQYRISDPGWAGYRWWLNIDGSGRRSFCRTTGNSLGKSLLCSRITARGIEREWRIAGELDQGYPNTGTWNDNDRPARYCRGVGNRAPGQLLCATTDGEQWLSRLNPP